MKTSEAIDLLRKTLESLDQEEIDGGDVLFLKDELEALAIIEANTLPDGWVAVPKTITEEMKDAAARVDEGPSVSYQEHWDAMLAAAVKQIKDKR